MRVSASINKETDLILFIILALFSQVVFSCHRATKNLHEGGFVIGKQKDYLQLEGTYF